LFQRRAFCLTNDVPVVDVGRGTDDTPVVRDQQLGVNVDQFRHRHSLYRSDMLYSYVSFVGPQIYYSCRVGHPALSFTHLHTNNEGINLLFLGDWGKLKLIFHGTS
jgi:hypothetical protein